MYFFDRVSDWKWTVVSHLFIESATCMCAAQSLIRGALSKPVAHSVSLTLSPKPSLVYNATHTYTHTYTHTSIYKNTNMLTFTWRRYYIHSSQFIYTVSAHFDRRKSTNSIQAGSSTSNKHTFLFNFTPLATSCIVQWLTCQHRLSPGI